MTVFARGEVDLTSPLLFICKKIKIRSPAAGIRSLYQATLSPVTQPATLWVVCCMLYAKSLLRGRFDGIIGCFRGLR